MHLQCPSGSFKDISGPSPCTPCSEGTYSGSVAAVSSSTCEACPLGSSAPLHSSFLEDCTCLLGHYASTDGVQCSQCFRGTYKTSRGVGNCTHCFNGKYSTTLAATTSAACLSCPSFSFSLAGSDEQTDCTCDAGYTVGAHENSAEYCVACPFGKYKSLYGQMQCTLCVAGKYSTTIASRSNSLCFDCPGKTVYLYLCIRVSMRLCLGMWHRASIPMCLGMSQCQRHTSACLCPCVYSCVCVYVCASMRLCLCLCACVLARLSVSASVCLCISVLCLCLYASMCI